MPIARRLMTGILLTVFTAMPVYAQWTTQELELHAGWNAVYLEVAPQPRSLDVIFDGLPVESVWKWDRRFSHIEFTSDPYELEEEDPHWKIWLPPDSPQRFLSRLIELQGTQSYLVRVATNATPFTVELKGKVTLPYEEWYPHGLNLMGMPVHPENPPTFSDFFAFSDEVDTTRGFENQLMRIDAAGRGVTIVQPMREHIEPGTAYWVGCSRNPGVMGPLDLTTTGVGELNFGHEGTRQELDISNTLTNRSMTVKIQQLASEAAPPGYPERAGPVPLSYLTTGGSNRWEWTAFPAEGLTRDVAPDETWKLILGIRRQDLTNYTPVSTNGYTYQSILEVSDIAKSLRLCVPVVAEKAPLAQTIQAIADPMQDHNTYEGLWVGSAVLDKVNAPAYSSTNVLATTAPLTMRLIVHMDGNGVAHLLQNVILAWDNTLTDPPHTNGTYALFYSDGLLPTTAEETYRISSVAFPLMAPLPLAGSFTNSMSGVIDMNYDDPTNPFLHKYHPMHDNKDWNFNAYSNAVETLSISRAISMQFEDPPTNIVHHPYWGVDRAMGTYKETMTGLRAQDIFVEGTFFLERISNINTLK